MWGWLLANPWGGPSLPEAGEYAECEDCGCAGTEDPCWSCGSSKRRFRGRPGTGHRHNPEVERVYLSGEMVPVTGENYRIIASSTSRPPAAQPIAIAASPIT